MTTINVTLESGKKKVFAVAVDWPGWSRAGPDETSALAALVDTGARYGQVLAAQDLPFTPPDSVASLTISDQLEGDGTTDYGAPAAILQADRMPVAAVDLERLLKILRSCWRSFDDSLERADGHELRKGPRGGGRDLEKIVAHVVEADRAYLRRLGGTYKKKKRATPMDELAPLRQTIEDALVTAVQEGLPASGPRGGKIWPVRTFVRRVAWHALDHTWEIQDRCE